MSVADAPDDGVRGARRKRCMKLRTLLSEENIHLLFDVSLWLKAQFAFSEILAGIATYFVSKEFLLSLVLWVTRDEFAEDPHRSRLQPPSTFRAESFRQRTGFRGALLARSWCDQVVAHYRSAAATAVVLPDGTHRLFALHRLPTLPLLVQPFYLAVIDHSA